MKQALEWAFKLATHGQWAKSSREAATEGPPVLHICKTKMKKQKWNKAHSKKNSQPCIIGDKMIIMILNKVKKPSYSKYSKEKFLYISYLATFNF